jgi:hypothetical protein
MEKIDTGLICCNCKPVYVGDKFMVQEHSNECCQHWILCEVRINPDCRCGYGLHDIETGKLIANAAIANYRAEDWKHLLIQNEKIFNKTLT